MSWEVKRLDELVSDFITKGATPTTTGHDWAVSGIPFLRSECVSADGFEPNGIRYITPEANTQLARSVVRSGDVLISITGNVGRVVRYPTSMPPGNINQHIARVRIGRDDVLPDFIVYQLLNPEQQERFGSIHVGAAYPLLSLKQIRETEVRVPPLPEQQRIVGVLDAAFAALREAEGHVERNRANARELFESYLNGVFEGKGDGWVEKRLGVLIDIQNGYAFSSNEYKDEGHFLIRISNVQDGEITLAKPKYVSIDDSRLKRFILNEGDILVSLTGNIGRVGIMQAEHLPAALNQRVARIILKDEKTIRHNFLFFFLRSNFFRKHLQAAGHGAAQQNVSTKEIAEVELSVPPLAEQQRVLDALRELQIKTDDLEATYQQKLSELDGLKKGLLGAAFRGEL